MTSPLDPRRFRRSRRSGLFVPVPGEPPEPPPPAPTVTLLAPADEAVLTVGVETTLAATATEETGVVFVVDGGAPLAATFNGGSGQWERAHTFTVLGPHTVVARATGPGGTTDSPAHDVTVEDVPAVQTRYGFHNDLTWNGATWRADAIERMDVTGATVSRNSFLWHMIEPTQGVFSWSRHDAVVTELTAAGKEIVFTMYGSPQWANGDANYLVVPQANQAAFDLWCSRYATFAATAVARYPQVKMWELWNEENEPFFWIPAPNIDRYVQWYNAVYTAMRAAAQPDQIIAMGGIAGLNASSGVAGKTWLQQMYDRGVFPEAVVLHPYSWHSPSETRPFENNISDVGLIKGIMDANEHDVPVWVTEWGYEVGEGLGKVTTQQQADWIELALQKMHTEYPFVTINCLFNDMDVTGYQYGLWDATETPRPSLQRYIDFLAGFA